MFVGNLALQTTDDQLLAAFEPYGRVSTATVMKNFATGETHGYGYVQMEIDSEAEHALVSMDGSELLGRKLTVIRQ